jgi:GNAT superfamily N-acetyltransferase
MTRVVREIDATSDDARRLIRALDEDLQARYPGALIQSIDPGTFAGSGGIFLVAYADNRPVACGALRPASGGACEIKRMFVLPPARRRGHARALLEALEARARDLDAPLLVLETGDAQPEAVSLYESAGYRPVKCFGAYAGSPHSRCFEKRFRSIDRVR